MCDKANIRKYTQGRNAGFCSENAANHYFTAGK